MTTTTKCPICREEFKSDAGVLPPCGHRLCFGCFIGNIATGTNGHTCCICRQDLFGQHRFVALSQLAQLANNVDFDEYPALPPRVDIVDLILQEERDDALERLMQSYERTAMVQAEKDRVQAELDKLKVQLAKIEKERDDLAGTAKKVLDELEKEIKNDEHVTFRYI